MYPSRWWFLLLFLSLLPRTAAAQGADLLTGRVVDVEGKPIVGARVEAISIETEITRSALTGSNGRYMILFPDGGGRYMLRVSFIGMATEVQMLMREGAEELLVRDFKLTLEPIQIDGLTAEVRRAPPQRADAGEQSTELSQEYLNRLPLPDFDPSTLALLAAGVIPTSLDSLTGRMGFSVAGMSDLLNQIVLDGVILGPDGVKVPQEGIRRTQVTTSTFDVSRGGFAGGQVSMTSARGNNRSSGTLSYQLDDDALQMNSAATTNAFTRHNIGGSWGGPIIRNKLFYNGSFQVSRNINRRYALAADDPLAALRSGVNVDSIGRFLSIVEDVYGFSTVGQTGRYNQMGNDLSLQGRIDWNLAQSQRQAHTLSARFNLSISGQDSTRINTMDLAQHGGETEQNGRLAALSLTSRLGNGWTNSLDLSYNHSWNNALPYIAMPEGVVQVTSDFEDGTRGTRSLVFGGNRSMPTEAFNRNLQLSEDLSLIVPMGGQLHRLKIGATLQRAFQSQRSTDNRLGTFTYSSLANFENNLPDRFERALTEREAKTEQFDGGLYVGNTWRISQPLEVTMGLRWDYSRLSERPAYNPAVEDAFGRRTDVRTSASGFSPRLGFNYQLNQPLQTPRSLSGGIGLFSGRAPTHLYSTAIRQTGLPDADHRLICIGSVVPIPAWRDYFDAGFDPNSIPDLCADGGPGTPPALSLRAPNVTLINPDQSLPTSLRLDLGYNTRLPFNLHANIRYGYSLGIGLWGYRDINLDESKSFELSHEGRRSYGDPSAIVPATGSSSPATSRLHDEFNNVYDVTSDLRSSTHQLTTSINGMFSRKFMVGLNYTMNFSKDEATGFMGGNTAGDPNRAEWSVSTNDRRHSLNGNFSYAFTPEIELALIGRISSGAPFTPIVNRDISGDGVTNDRAFIFDPRTAPDPEVAAAMQRLFDVVPDRIRSCLEAQLGTVAARNSCRNGWTQALDFRASLRPNLPGLQRRMTISVDGRNMLTGLDQLFHGRYEMKGWGEGRYADANLLEVRGFDPVSNNFIYEVNEGFGQTRRGPNAFRSPFSVTLSARVMLGGQSFISNRGFGGMAGQEGASMMGGVIAAMGSGARAGGEMRGGTAPNGFAELANLLGRVMRGGTVDIDSALGAVLFNPVPAVLALGDSLSLNADQIAALEAVSDTLAGQLAQRKEALTPIMERLIASVQPAGTAGRLNPELMQRARAEIQPHLDEAEKGSKAALQAVESHLTTAQWQLLPGHVRAGRRAGPRGGFGGNFNAINLIDRMLANPVPLILELRESLALTETQHDQVKSISDKLQEKLNKRREVLGRRFDNIPAEQQPRLFQEIQPELSAARREITDALRAVQRSLSAEQWNRIPERVRNPFQMMPGQQQ